MRASQLLSITLTMLIVLAESTASNAEVISVRSGSAPIATMLVATIPDGPLPTPFTATNFQAAVAGQNAEITTTNSGWVQSLSADPLAQWINNDGSSGNGRSVLYAIPFVLSSSFNFATLELYYMTDDHLGENVTVPSGNEVPGIYVNGIALPNTNGLGDFSSQHVFSAEIGALLSPGVNHLFLYCYDQYVDSGIIFSATITTVQVPNSTGATTWGALKALFS